MEKRDLYLEKINAQVEQYSAKLAGMRGKAAEVKADMKLEYLNQIEKLESKRDSLKEKYEELKKSGEDSWEDLKDGTENAWNELKEAVAKAADNFKKYQEQ
jgi:DNA phosphorothioation-dependent restriction protein DptG